MSQADSAYEPAEDAAASLRSAATRVDMAHAGPRESSAVAPPPDTGEWAAALAAPAVETTAAATIRQVRLQASQLAMHLQRQQATVDHREAELNARLAAMEKEIRSARLWLNERHEELASQQAELDRKEREFAAREAARGEKSTDGRGKLRSTSPPGAPADDVAQREVEIARREAELDAMARRLAEQAGRGNRDSDSNESRAINTRRENLDRLERLIESERNQLEHERRRLVDERTTLFEGIESERRKRADEGQQASAERDKARREVARQCDELAARHAALEQMRGDVFRGQQEALETRLATEELWARLCGTMAPAALVKSLTQIRRKLADEQRIERAEIAEQRAEVQALTARLAEQHQKLAAEREALQAWTAERQAQLAEQAERLAAAECGTERERAALEEQAAEWRRERRKLEDEIRGLLSQRSRGPSLAA